MFVLLYLEFYGQSSHVPQHSLHPHFQYPHENQSLSPQQTSTSDVDETSPTPSSSLNRTVKKKMLLFI